jgi:hypothetical protein
MRWRIEMYANRQLNPRSAEDAGFAPLFAFDRQRPGASNSERSVELPARISCIALGPSASLPVLRRGPASPLPPFHWQS